ncbi:MAG TPA: Lrp/AsnC family transcriptional regulator [Xanthomonadales bacterium]|nr:Lrp/AsnC family transcriptional regulator [Xanthomonadales bacterium]
MSNTLDAVDRRLLEILQADGRITNLEMAERLGLSPTPVARRWKRLEEEGYIRGYTALVDRKRVGYAVTAYVTVRLRSNNWQMAQQFEQSVAQLDYVMECAVVTGNADYLLRITARDLEDYERFVKHELAVIDPVETIDSTIVLSQTVERFRLPL